MARIIVVDDDEQARKLIGHMLESAGYEVELASDGKEGIELYRANPADLIVTDMLMPNEDGLQTITKLRRDYPDVKIIAISGGGRVVKADFLNIARSIGAIDTLKKPFEKEDLLKSVDKALAK